MSTRDVAPVIQGMLWHFESLQGDAEDLVAFIARLPVPGTRRHLVAVARTLDEVVTTLTVMNKGLRPPVSQVEQLNNYISTLVMTLNLFATALASAAKSSESDDAMTFLSSAERCRNLVAYACAGRQEGLRLQAALS